MTPATRTRFVTAIGMLSALAFAAAAVGRIPIVLFLKYDPKDIVIVIGGFLFGPLAALTISVIASAVEMISISETGILGFVMNVLSSCAFACTAAVVYRRHRTARGALVGLLAGWTLMVIVMMLWNVLIAPLYMGYPREAVVKLLLPAFLPFNLIKGGLNAALTLLLYKPVVQALRHTRLLAPESGQAPRPARFRAGITLVALFLLVTCVLLALVLRGVI